MQTACQITRVQEYHLFTGTVRYRLLLSIMIHYNFSPGDHHPDFHIPIQHKKIRALALHNAARLLIRVDHAAGLIVQDLSA